MEAIKISVTGAQAAVENAPVLTCGMVGMPVELSFDGAWEGLQKTLVYKAGGIIRDQAGVENAGTVPGQVLETPYRNLQIGVYGVSADGTVVIPTVWATVGQIREGANPSGAPGTQPSLPVWQQLMNRIEQLEADSKPELLWEFAYPKASDSVFDVSENWMDEYDFRFIRSDDTDKPWNDEWYGDNGDISLPATTTIREKFEELFELVKSKRHITVEFAFPGLISVLAHPAITTVTIDGVTVDKLILIFGDVTNPRTSPATLSILEITQNGIVSNVAIKDYAIAFGMQVRAYE